MFQRPVYSVNEAVNAQDDRRSRIDQIRENSARTALVDSRFSTLGSGQFKQEDAIELGLAFVSADWTDDQDVTRPLVPAVAYSFSLPADRTLVWSDQNTVALADANELQEDMPYCSGGVWRWERDGNGLYVGAYVFVSVMYDGTYDYEVEHYFTFYGTALKGLPQEVVEGMT